MRRCALLLVSALGLPPSVAAAVTPPEAAAPAPDAEQLERARTLFVTGSKAYNERKYAVAIDAFESAYALAPRASIVFALAQANRLQYYVDGEFERIENAVEYYRQYLERDDADPQQSDLAIRHLASLNPQLGRLSRKRDESVARLIVSADAPDAMVRLGDGPPQEVPAAFEMPPGPVQITVTAPGYASQTREVVTVGGTGLPIDVQLVPLPGTLTVQTEEGAEVRVDGRSLGSAPVAAQTLPPGTHRVVVLASGREPFVNVFALSAEDDVQVVAELEQTPQRIAAWATFGLAGALAVGSGITGALALDAQQDAEVFAARWQADGLDPEEADTYNGLVDERDQWTERTLILGVSAGVALALGGALWLFDDPQAPNQPVLTPSVAPGGNGAGLWGTFSF